jgi:hypothetical protein
VSERSPTWPVWIAGLVLFLVQLGLIRLQNGLPRSVSSVTTGAAQKVVAQAPSSTAGTSWGIGGASPPCSSDNPVTVEDIEHFNWSYCDFDLRPFWKSLGVPAGAFERSPSLFRVSSSSGDFDGDMIDERILNIQQNSVSRIVVLKHFPHDGWASIAFLDIPTFHLSPEARLVTNGKGRWLAVSHHKEAAWGTGIFQEEETWYADDHGRLREVLSFPETGELAGTLQFAWKTSATLRPFDGSQDVIDIDYAVTVGTSLGDGIEGNFHHTVALVKATSALKFGFDADLSQMKESEFLSLYDVGNLTWERWAKLVRLAAKHAPFFGDMFDRVLKACHNADALFWNCNEIAEELLRR